MGERFDVAIVGAGPAGISAACVLAEKGVKTVVFERGEYPGAKNMSGAVLYGQHLAQVLPDFKERNCPIERNIVEMRVWYLSKHGGYSISYRDQTFEEERKYNAFTVLRAKFDRWYADQARARGALVLSGTVVTDFLRDGDHRVTGVRVDREDGELRANVVLLADGINSALAAKTGFRPDAKPEHVALAVKEVIELPAEVIQERFNVGPEDGVTAEVLGEMTMGINGVAVVYTNKKSLSVAIGANLHYLAQKRIRPYEMLEEFKEHPMVAPLIRGGKAKEYLAHWLPEGGYEAIPQLCGDGFLIAGDSAMLFNALHREGSNLAMTSGRFAAEAIMDALEKGDFSHKGLSGYAERLQGSYVLKDLKKYRNFNSFLQGHEELFTTLPRAAGFAAREMLTVDSTPKKKKQRIIWKEIRKDFSLRKLFRLLLDAWRSVR
jgi:electron transfer flavoprotein-quinone oxidoreductase